MSRGPRGVFTLLACIGGASLAAGCGPSDAPVQHTVRGQVVRVSDGGRSLVVDHEAIPGYMDAMRMTLPVQDAAQSRGLEAGDRIRFELFVSGSRALIGGVEELPPGTSLELATGGGDTP